MKSITAYPSLAQKKTVMIIAFASCINVSLCFTLSRFFGIAAMVCPTKLRSIAFYSTHAYTSRNVNTMNESLFYFSITGTYHVDKYGLDKLDHLEFIEEKEEGK